MKRSDMFALRINAGERQMIEKLAHSLQRSQSDAIRLLIREAVLSLTAFPAQDVDAGWANSPYILHCGSSEGGNRENRS